MSIIDDKINSMDPEERAEMERIYDEVDEQDRQEMMQDFDGLNDQIEHGTLASLQSSIEDFEFNGNAFKLRVYKRAIRILNHGIVEQLANDGELLYKVKDPRSTESHYPLWDHGRWICDCKCFDSNDFCKHAIAANIMERGLMMGKIVNIALHGGLQ